MKLTESTNICCISNKVACTIKVNVKETFMGNDSFLQMLRIKDLLLDKFSI